MPLVAAQIYKVRIRHATPLPARSILWASSEMQMTLWYAVRTISHSEHLRTEKLPDRMLVYADDGEAALSHLVSRDIHPTGTLIRRATLEDVFLALTGRSLNE